MKRAHGAARGVVRLMTLGLALVGSLAVAAPGDTTRVSVSSSGEQGQASSSVPSLSGDGRFVVYMSDAANLVPSDGNSEKDIFLHDRQNGQTTRVSVNSGGVEGNRSSWEADISANGRYVAFSSLATNLVAPDTNVNHDIFVRDLATGETTRVSVSSDGIQGNSRSFGPRITSDGRFVVFASHATNLIPGDTNALDDIFVHDRQTGETTRVSVSTEGEQSNAMSQHPSISADGRYVAFVSSATNLTPQETNGYSNVFVHDRATGETTRVSLTGGGDGLNHSSDHPSLSADGAIVAFQSAANNWDGVYKPVFEWNIYVHNRRTRVTSRVDVPSSGDQSYRNQNSFYPSISADGRYVAFRSAKSNLVAEDTNGLDDIFVHDRAVATTGRGSVSSTQVQGNLDSDQPAISADGRFVAFTSRATNLVTGDTNGTTDDVFVHERDVGAVVLSNVSCGMSAEVGYILEQSYGDRLGTLSLVPRSSVTFNAVRAWLLTRDIDNPAVTLRIHRVTGPMDSLTVSNRVATSATAAIDPSGATESEFVFAGNVTLNAGERYVFVFNVDGHAWAYPDVLGFAGHPTSSGCDLWDNFIEYDDHFGANPNEVYPAAYQLPVAFVGAVVAPPGTPQLALLSTSQIDFGVVAVGQSALRSIRVRNTGSAPLQVSVAPGAPYVAREPSSLLLAPGAIGELNVAFAPTLVGRQDAAIQLVSNGGNATIPALGYAVRATTAVPAITSQVPASAAPYSIVSLRGRALGWTFGTVRVAGQMVNSTYWSDSAVDIVVPDLPAGVHALTVTTADGRVGTGQLTTLGPIPVITRLRPTSGTSGSDLVITGANFGVSSAEVAVTIGGRPATIVEWATDWLRVRVPEVPGALHPVTVSTSAGSAGSTFRVRPLLVNVEYGECVDYFAGVLWGLLEAPCPPVIATVSAGSSPGTTTLQLQNLTAKWYSVTATPIGFGSPVVVSPWIGPKARVTIADLAIPPGASLAIMADGTTVTARAIAVVDGMLSLCPALGVRCPRFPATAEAVELVRFTTEQSNEFVEAAIEIYDAVANGDIIDTYTGISDLLVLASEDPYVGAMFVQLGMDVDTASANAVSNFLRVFKATALALESVFAPPFGTVTVQAD